MSPAATTAAPLRPLGLRLTEVLEGWWSPEDDPDHGNRSQYLDAASAGEAAGRGVRLDLTLSIDDITALTADLSTPMTATGTVRVADRADEAAQVHGGTVRLVVPDPGDPDVSHMRYELPIPDAGLHISGFKVLTDGDVTQLWRASTTLHVTIRSGGADGTTTGRGVVRLSPAGFVEQLRSLDVPDHEGGAAELAALARFGAAFFGALWDDYGTVVQRSAQLRRDAPPRRLRPLDVPPPSVHPYRTDDGVDLRLTRYRGGDRGPVVLVHGMGANPRSYTLDTVRPNLVEHLVAHRFDVWLQEWRASTLLPAARTEFDGDQVARYDHPAAELAVRQLTGRRDVHWVTHCVGSITWTMATLSGSTTPASLLLSQVGAHPVSPGIQKLKAGLRAPGILRTLGVRALTTDTYDDGSWGARLLDQVLRLHPIPRDERCDSAVCRRLAFIYGNAIRHAAVDEVTHDHLHELFGTTNLRMMAHLARCSLEEHVVTADGEDAYRPHVARMRLPVTILHGAHNGVYLPVGTERDHAWLTDAVGAGWVERVVLDRAGHQDTLMGAEAHEYAFPAIVAHLERAGA